MKQPTRVSRLLLLVQPLLLGSATDHESERFHNTFKPGKNLAAIRAGLGEPQPCQQSQYLDEKRIDSYDRFTLFGKMYRRSVGKGK